MSNTSEIDRRTSINPIWQLAASKILGLSIGQWVVRNPYKVDGYRTKLAELVLYRMDKDKKRLMKSLKRFVRGIESKRDRWSRVLSSYNWSPVQDLVATDGSTYYQVVVNFIPYEDEYSSFDIQLYASRGGNGPVWATLDGPSFFNLHFDRMIDEAHRAILDPYHGVGRSIPEITDMVDEYEELTTELDSCYEEIDRLRKLLVDNKIEDKTAALD
jgi:hypothetical protein